MGWQRWLQETKKPWLSATSIEIFHKLTVSLLSLLVPLSFLLLARLSSYNYVLSITSDPNQPPSSFLSSLLLKINPAILYALASFVSVSTLVHGLTGKITFLSESSTAAAAAYRPRLYTAWILLCTLQIFVGLGIEGSIAAGIDGFRFDPERSLFSRIIFFLGLHETTLHWSRTVVKPVVDDTVFGSARKETWVQKFAIAVSFGGLWWWRLRDEVESLVIVAEIKMEMMMGVGVVDLIGWWLYYVTVTIGMVRVVKGLMWVGVILLCRRVTRNPDDSPEDEDKV
ncbi:hypothetical protein Tsubulata_037519 [Turnera subulata]|uniref:Transmembrane protein n=1 Tax=Turnera subulata TaxID=218843 RepID=A0A9Q0G5Z5_9ROSI|nr:hypothetical protein Tsubulata_037519 [Turnera subulata]